MRLPVRLPFAIAAEVVLAGRRLAAEEALSLGLVNRIVAPQEVLSAAVALAARCAEGAPIAVRESLAAMRAATEPSDEAWSRSDAAQRVVDASDDGQEGARAFAAKRPPVWQGR